MRIIAFSGKMQTGKTTTARLVADKHGGIVVSFADQLRDEIEEHFGIPAAVQRDPEAKANLRVDVGLRRVRLRELLQWWGGLRREGNPNYWVDKLVRKVQGCRLVVIDDVRYRNEAEAIQRLGGTLIRLEPHDKWTEQFGCDHISETDLDDYEHFDMTFRPGYGGLPALVAEHL